jgi:hypothetical protein
MLQKLFSTGIAMALVATSFAQDTAAVKTSALKISGSADAYYRYNFNNPENAPYNNFTSFTNSHNSFELGMASLKAEHSIGKVGMVADLGFGRRAEEFSYNDENTMLAIKQLYITYAPSAKVKLTAGSWATHVGYELVDAALNRNYSMSYMFSYGPFFHTGLKADIALGGKNSLMVGVTNPTDLKSASRASKFIIGQFATGSQDDKLKAYVNYQGGKTSDSSKLNQGDVVVTYAVSPKFSLGYNGTVQFRQAKENNKWSSSDKWWGSALYVNVDPTDWFGFTLRSEYLSDKKSLLGFDGNIFSNTLSANFKIDNLRIIPELRFDNASKEIFSNGSATKGTASGLVAVVYSF